MDEGWERAVETALDGNADCASVRTLTLDGAVKCVHGRLPPPELLEKFQSLEHLSIANVGVSTLEKFPRLRNLQKLILSDNRIAGGLEFLVEAGLDSLRDLDLSNNRIQYIEDLAPLAQLRLVSLDLYECPVTRVKDYRSRVFGMIRSLKYLDKMDADDNEPPETDEEEEEEDDEEEEEDPGSGEIDGEERPSKLINGGSSGGIVDADEDEESDADEEETEIRVPNGINRGPHNGSNGFRVAANRDDEDDDEVEDEDEDDLGEEIDEDGEEEDVVEVHEIEDSDEDEDGVEEDDDSDDDDEDDDEEEEDVEDEEEDVEPGSTGRLTSTEGEIDGHEQGEEDENGEIGEEEQGVEEDGEYEEDDGEGDDEEEDIGSEYLVQPIGQVEEDAGGSDLDTGNEDDGEEEEVEDEEDNHDVQARPCSSQVKRKRGDGFDDESVEDERSSKHH